MNSTDRTAYDLIITALEGGIGYWSQAEILERGTADYDLDYVQTCLYVETDLLTKDQTPQGAHTFIASGYLGEYEMTEVGMLNLATIRRGMAKAQELGGHYIQHLADIATENYDADTADVIVQLGIFGEVVFG